MDILTLLVISAISILGLIVLYFLLKSHIEKKLIESLTGIRERLEDVGEIRKDLQRLYLAEHLLKELGEDLRRLSQIFLSRRSGKAGERGLEELLSVLPSHMLRRDLQIDRGVVEFALVLDEEKYLPIDSKFTCSELLMKEELTQTEERELMRRVRDRAKELATYLKDEKTIGFGIMACPDGLFPYLQRRVYEELERERLLLVPYSLLLPVLLFIHYLWKKFGKTYNFEEVSSAVDELERTLSHLEKDLERFSKEIRTLESIYHKLRDHHSKLVRDLKRLTESTQSSTRSRETSE